MTLKEFFRNHPRVAVAFSGGVDSAFLLYSAKVYADSVCAYYVKSEFQPQFELDDALSLTSKINVPMKVLYLNILKYKTIAENKPDRCYYCKKQIFSFIQKAAAEDGFSVLLDGTNASDRLEDRPGMRAIRELQVLSPLRICGLTKDKIRSLSREADLFTWNKPAYACLATRIAAGQYITDELLRRTEYSEQYLSSLGFADFRIRTAGDTAKIQILSDQFQLMLDNRQAILDTLSKVYSSVLLDLEARDEH